MDITPVLAADKQHVQSYGPKGFKISNLVYLGPVIVFPDQTIPWPVTSIDNLTFADFQPIIDIASDVEVILLGCGKRGVMVLPKLRIELKNLNISIDSMSTGAACRTHNVMLPEERHVVAALMPA